MDAVHLLFSIVGMGFDLDALLLPFFGENSFSERLQGCIVCLESVAQKLGIPRS